MSEEEANERSAHENVQGKERNHINQWKQSKQEVKTLMYFVLSCDITIRATKFILFPYHSSILIIVLCYDCFLKNSF